ncbi:MAG TPA: hypothetical protein VNI01_07545, partial [Elusimicrobiota bacterium]|nr:hypothetical protein [Elusimicrobiota bacterium]
MRVRRRAQGALAVLLSASLAAPSSWAARSVQVRQGSGLSAVQGLAQADAYSATSLAPTAETLAPAGLDLSRIAPLAVERELPAEERSTREILEQVAAETTIRPAGEPAPGAPNPLAVQDPAKKGEAPRPDAARPSLDALGQAAPALQKQAAGDAAGAHGASGLGFDTGAGAVAPGGTVADVSMSPAPTGLLSAELLADRRAAAARALAADIPETSPPASHSPYVLRELPPESALAGVRAAG